jgi:hypothetical protein
MVPHTRSKKWRFAFQTFTETTATAPSTLGFGITHQPHEGGDGPERGTKLLCSGPGPWVEGSSGPIGRSKVQFDPSHCRVCVQHLDQSCKTCFGHDRLRAVTRASAHPYFAVGSLGRGIAEPSEAQSPVGRTPTTFLGRLGTNRTLGPTIRSLGLRSDSDFPCFKSTT